MEYCPIMSHLTDCSFVISILFSEAYWHGFVSLWLYICMFISRFCAAAFWQFVIKQICYVMLCCDSWRKHLLIRRSRRRCRGRRRRRDGNERDLTRWNDVNRNASWRSTVFLLIFWLQSEWGSAGMVIARCKWFAYGPADATATPSSLASLKSRSV